MNIKQIKYELQNLISGKSGASYDALIQTAADHLRTGKRTSPMAEEKHQNKAQETAGLIDFAKANPHSAALPVRAAPTRHTYHHRYFEK